MELLALPVKNNPMDVNTNKPLDAVSIRSGRSTVSMRKDPKEDTGRPPHPSHRHASPSAPWPWVDLEDEVDREQLDSPLPPIPAIYSHENCGGCWRGYPQSRFPNWTARQVKKSKIWDAVNDYYKATPCVCHQLCVGHDGRFYNLAPIIAKHGDEANTWTSLVEDKQEKELVGARVRALFIENLSGPMLQMLGTKYNIEPSFWSSSLRWIPSRFQEEVQPRIGDHITITLTFVRSMTNHDAIHLGHAFGKSTDTLKPPRTLLGTQKIDPHSPLVLHSNNRLLVQDLLAVHLIRNVNGSTIISFHPTLDLPTTTASFLHERIRFAGQSVYWQSIFQRYSDPTFVLLTFVWHGMYAWDEALEHLYDHLCNLESRVITAENMSLTLELHVLRAHYLHYNSLLDDYSKHVHFIRDTYNPAMDSIAFAEDDRQASKIIMTRECSNLLAEISRLMAELRMQERRLQNLLDLTGSLYMRTMTQATVRDSQAMKQITYLTMFFLPATFVSGVFGMNVRDINPGTSGSMGVFFAIAIPLTFFTLWIAFCTTYNFPPDTSLRKKLLWPIQLIRETMQGKPPNPKYDFDSVV